MQSLKRLANGQLLVRVQDAQSRANLATLDMIQSTPVKVTIPVKHNTCKGIFYSEEAFFTSSDSELLEFISNPLVHSVKKLRVHHGASRVPVIATFVAPSPPDVISVGWERFQVKTLDPPPPALLQVSQILDFSTQVCCF